ncbi:transposase [Streptomyces sp. NBC_01604]|uniref:transposase n=1 Tax=Streptomyces sp. NBC_01604 TaxID=2975894 RepID=UPI0038644A1C
MQHLPQVEDALGQQTIALLHQLDAACTNAEQLAASAVQAFEQHPDAMVITSFPGLGPLTGSRVLGEIGDDRARFASAGSLKAYAGSAQVTRASGKSCVVMSRRVERLTTRRMPSRTNPFRSSPPKQLDELSAWDVYRLARSKARAEQKGRQQ